MYNGKLSSDNRGCLSQSLLMQLMANNPPRESTVNIQIKRRRSFSGPCPFTHLSIKIAARIMLAALCLSGSSVFAACEKEAAALCSHGDPQCLDGAAKSVAQAANDCKTPEGRIQNASLWQATPSFFDNAPHEHEFWRCVARQCDSPQQPGQ